MAIEVSVVGTGSFRGSKSNLSDYSVQEQITPLDGSLPASGVGTVQFGATENDDSRFLLDNEIELRDGARGIVSGTIRDVNSGDLALNVTADSILSLLLATRTVGPFEGTLEEAITHYLSLVEVETGFVVSDEIANRQVLLGGWSDSVLSAMSDLCVAQQIEMSVVYDQIVFRPARINTAVTSRKTSTSWRIDRGNPALSVQIYYYNYETLVDGLVYPSPLEEPRGGFQVDIGQTLNPVRIPVSAFLSEVSSPTPVNFLPPNHGDDEYVVLGSDQLPIPADEWTAKGGKVEVSIDPNDTSYIVLTVTGMTEPNDPRAPYRVGVMSSGGGAYYPALYVAGSGVRYDKKLFTVPTGASNTQVEIGVTIDNPLISTLDQALTVVPKAAHRYSGINYSISGGAVSVNRPGAGNEFATSKLSAFDDFFSGQKLESLDDLNWTFSEFDAYFAGLVINQFENQLFGNAGGARILEADSYFRIEQATTTPGAVSYSATQDTLWGDWDSAWSGEKLAAWDDVWDGLKLRDWEIRPLKEAA